MSASCLTKKNLLKLLLLFGVRLGVELIHGNELNFVGVRQRWIDPFTVNELAQLGHDFHAFVIEEIVDEQFSGIGMRRLVVERNVIAVAEHFRQPYIV